jgi:hypothetical protein
MALANLTARSLRVYIGADDQEWSFAAADFLPEFESIGEQGLVKTFAQITLLEVLSAPESLEPRANPTRWREGQTVRVDVATNAGGWSTWGLLRLLSIPSGPSDGAITLELGCALAWADDPQPEGDRSEVVTGVGENSATVATRLLVASGIPEASIALGTWEYALPYPLQKEGSGSYVAQAGALAFANHCRGLYQDSAGIVRSCQWSATPGTPVATVTVGQDEALFLPSPDPVPPVERVVVSGVGYEPSTTPNRYSSSFSVTEPASNFSDDAIGSVVITTTEVYEWGPPDDDRDYYWTYNETRLQQPRCLTWIGSDSVQSATAIAYEARRYDATTQILYQIETGEVASVKTLVDATVTAFGTTLTTRTITTLEHDATLETLTRRTETTAVPRIQLTGETGSGGRFEMVTARIADTRWTEDRPDYWVERTSERIAAKNGSGRQGNIKPTALITQPPQVRPNSRPPATDRWVDPVALQERHYSAEATWQHPGGATGRIRTRSLTLTPGFSNAQCFEVATREVALLEGRRESYLIELPLSTALLWVAPLSTIEVDDGTNLWTFKLDAPAWAYATDEARLTAAGICVGRVAVEVPAGTPLPEFETGLEPGQTAPAEPPVFEPPTDEVGGEIDVAIASSPMTMAAVLSQAATVDVAIASSPMTMAAVVQNRSIDVAIAGTPMTMAAAISGAETVDTGLYTGNGTSQSIVTGFQPDLIWIKPKASSPPTFVDSTNGASRWFDPASANAFATDANAITAFNSNGFSVGSSTRVNTNAVVNRFFAWKESPTFEVVTYTGNGSARTISHSLGVAPAFIMVKRVNASGGSRGYHKTSGATITLNLNTSTNSTSISFWNNTAPTTTVFSLGTSTDVNANGSNYVAYLFAESAGITKIDAYTGNGSTTGPVVDVGFAPKIVGIRRSDGTALHIYSVDDSNNPFRFGFDAEVTTPLTFLSDGFQPASNSSNINTNAASYHYVAWG